MAERAGVTAKKPEKNETKKRISVSKRQKTDFSKSISSPANQILSLQRTIGNQAVQRLIKSGVIQKKNLSENISQNEKKKEYDIQDRDEKIPIPLEMHASAEHPVESGPSQKEYPTGEQGTSDSIKPPEKIEPPSHAVPINGSKKAAVKTKQKPETSKEVSESAGNAARGAQKAVISRAISEQGAVPSGEPVQKAGGASVQTSTAAINVPGGGGEAGGGPQEQSPDKETMARMTEASDEGEIESEENITSPPPGVEDSSVDSDEREMAETEEEEETEVSPPAATAGGVELVPAERDAAMSSLARGSGGEAAVSGGGGGGAAIEEKSEPQAPDVAGAEPSQAIAAISGLPPAKMAAALGGVSSAVSRFVGEQRSELAASPPAMERPSGAPATRKERSSASIPAPHSEKGRPVERVPEGKATTVPQPRPLPPAPVPPTEFIPQPQIQSSSEGQVSDSDAAGLQASVRQLPTTDPGLEISAGAPPSLDLEGDADPSRIQEQKGKLDQSIAEAQTQGRQDAVQPMGENEIYPEVPREILSAKIRTGRSGSAPGGTGGAFAVGAGSGDKEVAASIIAREQQGAEIQAAVAKAQKDMTARRQEHRKKVSREQAKSQEEIALLEVENADEQASERGKAQTEVQDLRSGWTKEQQEAVDRSNEEANMAKQQASEDVAQEREQGETRAAEHVEEGDKEAAKARREGEKEAARIKKEGKEESSGVFGWLASKAKAFFNRIKNGIKAAFDRARALVRSAIEKAKKLATWAIEKARQAIVAVIRKIGNVLIAIGDRLLANFPKMRDRFRKAIKDRVAKAEAAVNRLADKLKKGVQKALDMLGAALDAAIGLMEKGMLAAVDAAGKVVQGAIKAAQAVVNAVAAFASLIKDIAAGPGQWIRNLGASIIDGIRNYIWKAFKEAVKNWFNQKLEEVLGLGTAIWNLLKKGGIAITEIGKMVWEALKSAIPVALIQILVEKLVSMIVPAAGAVMVIIEGLQAAWGTVKRVIQAFGRFFAFLKAVKKGNAGPQFAAALAAAAIVVIDFVANWLLRRLRKPAGKVAGKIRAIAQRIMQKVKKAAKKVAAKVKGVASKIKARVQKAAGRFGKRKKAKEPKPKKSKSQKAQDRLDKAVRALQPKITSLLTRGVSRIRLTAQLAYWRIRYRLTRLEVKGQGENVSVVAAVNPTRDVVKNIVEKHGALLLAMIRLIGREILKNDTSVREHLERIIEQRAAGKGREPERPIIHEPGLGFQAQASEVSGAAQALGIHRSGTIRTPWTLEHMEFGGVPLKEWQTYSSGAGHIRVGGVGTYDQILTQWEGIRGATVSTDAEIALAMRVFRQTGHLDPKFGSYKTQLAALNRLLFGVEMGRSSAQVVTGTALMDLMEKGQITASQGLKTMHPMAPPGAVRTAAGVSEKLEMEPERKYRTKASPKQIQQMIETELEVMTHYLYAKMQIEKPLFSTVRQLETFIKKHLRDYLKSEIMSGFTLTGNKK